MKRFFTLLIAVITLTTVVNSQALFISEIADPGDDYNARFVELFNPTAADIDLAVMDLYLVKETNAGSSYSNIQLSGTIAAGQPFVIAVDESGFTSKYAMEADMYNSNISGNGDDSYMLFVGGDMDNGTLYDNYGELTVDGTGTAWEYEDSRAERIATTLIPNVVWTASEWVISAANVADCTPGTHNGSVPPADLDVPVWATGYPMADVEDVQFDLLAKLDETSTVYYVVLANDATAPTVDEVKAGTGAAAAVAIAAGSFTAGTSETAETITGLVVETSYDVYVVAEDDEATPNVQAAVSLVEITTVVMPDVLMKATFDSDLSPFTAVSVIGDDQTWIQSSGYAKVTGYVSGTSYANEDWLVSPGIDLAAATGEVMSFETANNYGDATSTLQVMISNDFSGTYDVASIQAATWTDITSDYTLSSGGSWSFVPSGDVDFSANAESGIGYLAFVYVCTAVDAGTWEVDNFKYTGFLVPGADATLSDLTVDATTVEGFDPATLNYTVELPAGTTTIPVIAGTTTDDMASAVMTPATDLAGDAAARTATIAVTAQDGTTTQDYTVVFNPIIEVADLGALRAMTDESRKYVVTGEVVLTHKDGYRNKKYFEDATGAVEIDDSPGVITTVLNIGDGVTGLEGTIEDYNGMLQMHPTADAGAATTTGNAVTAQVLTAAEFVSNFESYESELVSIEGVTFADAGGSFANGINYVVTVGTDATVARTHFYDVVTGTIPNMADITGIAVYHYDEAKVGFRSQSDIVAYSSDATLSDLTVDAATVTDFAATTMSYTVLLPEGTTTVPTVAATVTDANASLVITDATDLAGDAAARTTTVAVTAQDGTTADYTVVFELDVNVFNASSDNFRIYPNPANEVLNITSENVINSFEVIDITGASLKSGFINASGLNSINVSDLERGVYFIKLQSDDATAALRFVKQ